MLYVLLDAQYTCFYDQTKGQKALKTAVFAGLHRRKEPCTLLYFHFRPNTLFAIVIAPGGVPPFLYFQTKPNV